jgi:hypothetical protein
MDAPNKELKPCISACLPNSQISYFATVEPCDFPSIIVRIEACISIFSGLWQGTGYARLKPCTSDEEFAFRNLDPEEDDLKEEIEELDGFREYSRENRTDNLTFGDY